ncbi:membrane protein insertion efficiency factor YidD [Providencia stuartii]|nr:membrane protein insertion efficiency factor YidD [Providencia stuartii]HEM6870795.1 membrane protein insertion efficiency factor YidD [Providencia stuartii]HEM8300837.1 membrane protein insertion efficiency factor YidD [Providencia stuartii]
MKWLSIKFILFYRTIAPSWMRDSCRYAPSCSEYAILAIQKYGVIKGWSMAIKRIYRCKPPFGGRDLP